MRTEKQIKNMRKSWEPENKELANKQKEKAKSGLSPFVLCHSKNKPPAMQGEDRSLDISMNSCAKIKVGLQNHK